MGLRTIELFAGAGGGVYASKLLGHRTVCYVEHNDYCQRVIRQRIRDGIFGDAPIWDDVRTFDGRPWRGKVDCIAGGFPCQPFSVAGGQLAEGDPRNMWPETIRIIREVGPRVCFLENVPGLLSARHGYFGTILEELAEAGYDARWCVLGADDVGSPHVRKRLWLFAWRANADSARQLQPQGRVEGERRRAGDMGGQVPDADSASLRPQQVADSEGLRQQERSSSERGEQEHAMPGVSGWWSAEPSVGRVADGVADRGHRLKALGNGQCSLVAATAFRLLAGAD